MSRTAGLMKSLDRDGEPARAYGGAANVVAYAREHGTPMRVIWPDGVQRK